MELDQSDLAQQEPVVRFIESAQAFCQFLEECQPLTSHQFVVQAADLLTRLYRSGLALPDVEPTTSDILRETIPREIIFGFQGETDSKSGKYVFYYEVFDPFEDTSPVVG